MRQDAEEAELRNSDRAPSVLEGKIYFSDGTSESCRIKDLSAGGAKIEVRENVTLPTAFDLVIFEVKFRICAARLQWQEGKLAGVSFARKRPA